MWWDWGRLDWIGQCPQIYGGNEDFFVKCFPLLDKKKVLILHFRLSGSIDVHARCMQILHKCYVFYFFIGTSLNQMLLFPVFNILSMNILNRFSTSHFVKEMVIPYLTSFV